MQLRLMKRILATALCVAMLSGDCLPVFAQGATETTTTETTTEEQSTETGEGEDAGTNTGTDSVVVTETPASSDLNTGTSGTGESSGQTIETTSSESIESSTEEASSQGSSTETSSSESASSESSTDEKGSEGSTEQTTEETTTEVETTIEEGKTPLDGSLKDIVLEKEVNGVIVTLTAAAGVLPENAELSVTEIENTEEEAAVMDEALEAKANEQDQTVTQYRAFDITILVDGVAVQPEGDVTVNFAGDLLVPTEEETVSVYHVDDEVNVNEVTAEATEDGVAMTTDHFSKYVVMTMAALPSEYNLKVRHYYAIDADKNVEERDKFYEGQDCVLKRDDMLAISTAGGDDYNLTKIVFKDAAGNVLTENPRFTLKNKDDKELKAEQLADAKKIDLIPDQDMTVELFYKATTDKNHRNKVTYFDYSIMSEAVVETAKDTGIQDGGNINCTYNGVEYTGVFFKKNKKAFFTPNNNGKDKKAFSIEKGDKIFNVTKSNGTEYSELTYGVRTELGTEAKFYVLEKETKKTAKDAGINVYGKKYPEGTYLAMGQTNVYHSYTLKIKKDGVKDPLNANINESYYNRKHAIIPNLVTGLTTDLKDVVTGKGVNEPGYFNDKPLNGKKIFSERYDLKFEREGHKYKLISSVDKEKGDKEVLSENGSNKAFFPLNDNGYEDTAKAVGATGATTEPLKTHGDSSNCFFGMRYDFQFQLGDYVGPLNYTFVGDDDLWVFMDGKRVLDLGGMHSAFPTYYSDIAGIESNTVDLWEHINKKEADYKTKTHQITVLYMERGAWDSSCYMEFTIPQVSSMDTIITDKPKGNVEFIKTTADFKTPLAGAVFGLYSDEAGQIIKIQEQTSDKNGLVSFKDVKEGDYFVQEIKAPEGYRLNENKYPVTVKAKETTTVNVDNKHKGKIINREIKTMDYSFTKIDGITKKKIEGIKFELYAQSTDESIPTEETSVVAAQNRGSFTKLVASCKSDANGKVEFLKLPAGRYLIKETKSPGYKNAGPWILSIEKDVKHDLFAKLYDAKKDADGNYVIDGGAYRKNVIKNYPASGSLIINKTVNKVNLAYGAPTFMFKIEGPNEAGNDKLVLYRTITFENATDTNVTQSVKIDHLPVGHYTVTELPTLRYTCQGETVLKEKVGEHQIPEFNYTNHLTNEEKYSHSDILVNSFVKDDNGSVTITQQRETITELKEVDENSNKDHRESEINPQPKVFNVPEMNPQSKSEKKSNYNSEAGGADQPDNSKTNIVNVTNDANV